jgi:hypothetical protein
MQVRRSDVASQWPNITIARRLMGDRGFGPGETQIAREIGNDL